MHFATLLQCAAAPAVQPAEIPRQNLGTTFALLSPSMRDPLHLPSEYEPAARDDELSPFGAVNHARFHEADVPYHVISRTFQD